MAQIGPLGEGDGDTKLDCIFCDATSGYVTEEEATAWMVSHEQACCWQRTIARRTGEMR